MQRAVRHAAAYRKVEQEVPQEGNERSFKLVAGTVLYDGGDMFRLTDKMQNLALGPVVGVSPSDANRLGITHGKDVVVVSNSHGKLTLQAKIDAQIQPGTVWIPQSLLDAPVGVLLNGDSSATVEVNLQP